MLVRFLAPFPAACNVTDFPFDAVLFDCDGVGHEMPRSKPYPDVYLAAASALGVDPRRCAVLEDTVTGATAGVVAGATVFGYRPRDNGHSSPEALRDVGVAHVFTDMAQLPALLAGWAAYSHSASVGRR